MMRIHIVFHVCRIDGQYGNGQLWSIGRPHGRHHGFYQGHEKCLGHVNESIQGTQERCSSCFIVKMMIMTVVAVVVGVGTIRESGRGINDIGNIGRFVGGIQPCL